MSGVLNSVNTNYGAMVALQSLNSTSMALNNVQNQVSTGYRVSSAVDDGAAFAVAQSMRANVAGLTAANQQLGNVQGLLGVTTSALTSVSNLMQNMQSVLVDLSNSAVTGNQRTQYQAQYTSMVKNVQVYLQNASYNGTTLVGNIAGSTGNFTAVTTIINGSGGQYSIATSSGSSFYHSISFTTAQLGASTAAAALTATGTFTKMLSQIGTDLNTYGNATNYVTNQQTYNSNVITALNSGLGALVDANMAQESAQLQSLQIKQQLGTSALSIADQAPSMLLKLFP